MRRPVTGLVKWFFAAQTRPRAADQGAQYCKNLRFRELAWITETAAPRSARRAADTAGACAGRAHRLRAAAAPGDGVARRDDRGRHPFPRLRDGPVGRPARHLGLGAPGRGVEATATHTLPLGEHEPVQASSGAQAPVVIATAAKCC